MGLGIGHGSGIGYGAGIEGADVQGVEGANGTGGRTGHQTTQVSIGRQCLSGDGDRVVLPGGRVLGRYLYGDGIATDIQSDGFTGGTASYRGALDRHRGFADIGYRWSNLHMGLGIGHGSGIGYGAGIEGADVQGVEGANGTGRRTGRQTAQVGVSRRFSGDGDDVILIRGAVFGGYLHGDGIATDTESDPCAGCAATYRCEIA